jgi:hypothetical protein
MKDSGKTIYRMDMELKHGLTVQSMKEFIKMERNMEEVAMFGVTVLSTLVNGLTTRSME